jgi:hypothetical protein
LQQRNLSDVRSLLRNADLRTKFLPQVLIVKINSPYKGVGATYEDPRVIYFYLTGRPYAQQKSEYGNELKRDHHRFGLFYEDRFAIGKNHFGFLLAPDDLQSFVLNRYIPGEGIAAF